MGKIALKRLLAIALGVFLLCGALLWILPWVMPRVLPDLETGKFVTHASFSPLAFGLVLAAGLLGMGALRRDLSPLEVLPAVVAAGVLWALSDTPVGFAPYTGSVRLPSVTIVLLCLCLVCGVGSLLSAQGRAQWKRLRPLWALTLVGMVALSLAGEWLYAVMQAQERARVTSLVVYRPALFYLLYFGVPLLRMGAGLSLLPLAARERGAAGVALAVIGAAGTVVHLLHWFTGMLDIPGDVWTQPPLIQVIVDPSGLSLYAGLLAMGLRLAIPKRGKTHG